MIHTNELPPCRHLKRHDFSQLGTEDNGDKVSRCGSCMTVRYEGKDGALRYELPGDPEPEVVA